MPARQDPPPTAHASGFSRRIGRYAAGAAGLLIVLLALWGLYGMLRHSSPQDILAAMRSLSPHLLALALLTALLAYVPLTLYDQLGLRWLGRRLPWRRSAPVTATAYALGNVSFNALVVAAGVRYAGFRQEGLGPADIARMSVLASLGFWLGYAALGGVLFAVAPLTDAARSAALLAGMPLAYLLLAARLRTLRLGRFTLDLPQPSICAGQIGAGMLDLLGISTVLWLLMPDLPGLSYAHFLQAFMLAMVAGSASQAPGGLGVFDSAFLLLMPAGAPLPQVVAALLAFRVLYYAAPLACAGLALAARSAMRRVRRG